MASEKPFPERFKKFMKSDKKNIKPLKEIKITPDILTKLSSNSPLSIRLETIKDLEQQYEHIWLEEGGIERIWNAIKDMMKMDQPLEHRQIALNFMGATIANSGIDRLGVNRIIFITHILDVYKDEDITILFDFFCIIVANGRHIEHAEDYIEILITDWVIKKLLKEFYRRDKVINFLTLLLKFNAAHIDDSIVKSLVRTITDLILQVRNKDELLACNEFLDTIICYVYIPHGTLYQFLYSLTFQASIPNMVDQVWKIVQNLLRTEVGVTGVHYLCCIIEKEDYSPEQFHFIRGAIFFIARALWSEHKINSLTYTPMYILKTFTHAYKHTHPLVIYEIGISLSFLVRNCSSDLHMSSWDMLLDILGHLLNFTANHNNEEHCKMMFNVMNTVMDQIEEKIANGSFSGSLTSYYALVDKFSEIRQEPSVLSMLAYNIQNLSPLQSQWLNQLTETMKKHFTQESRPAIRLKILKNIKYLFDKFTRKDSFDICNCVVLNHLFNVDKDPNLAVRTEATQLLVHMVLHIRSPIITSMLLIIEKVVLKPYAKENRILYNKEEDLMDVYEGVKGLILIFKKKIWCLPSKHAIRAYQILMSSLELHYRETQVLEHMTHIRKEIFDMVFELRADHRYHLGLPNCPEALLPMHGEDSPELRELLPRYTSYIVVDHKHGQKPKSDLLFLPQDDDDTSSTSSLDCSSSAEEEVNTDFRETTTFVVSPIKKKRPGNEQELPLDSQSEESSSSHSTVPVKREEEVPLPEYSYEEDKIYSECFDVNNLEPATEVAHLSLTQAARLVIVAMKKEKDWSLLKMILERIPQVLQNKALILSKEGNDIDYLALTLTRLVTTKDINSFYNTPPKFSQPDFHSYIFPVMATLASYHQYMTVKYQTNVIHCLTNYGMYSKSSSMCVSALTTCVLEMRTAMTKVLKDVMIELSKISATVQNAQPTLEFLSTVLHLPKIYADFSLMQTFTVIAICTPYTNPFKFNAYIVSLAYHVICMWFLKCRKNYRQHFIRYISKNLYMILLNEGSAKKSPKGAVAQEQQKKKEDDEMIQFHRDLHEICVDFMARNCCEINSPIVHRGDTCEMLLKHGLTRTWLFGTRIITITTSGCYDRPFKKGICKQCCNRCNIDDESINERKSSQDLSSNRRRHKSDFHRTISHETKVQPQTSKDDIHMRPLSKESSQSTVTDPDEESEDYVCGCWCRGWAEVFIRQPTGNDCFMFRFQNRINHISRENTIPVNNLSNFYTANIGQSQPEEQQSSSLDRDLYGYGHLPEDIRPRALSGASEKTQASEWSNSASGPSSGAASLASSEIKLDTKADAEQPVDAPHLPVHHCRSNPEVNKGENPEAPSPTSSTTKTETSTSPHPNLAPSKSLIEGTVAASSTAGLSTLDKGRLKLLSQCHGGSMNSPSPPPSLEESQRIRHSSALQMKSSASSAAVCEQEEDSNLQPIKRGRGHTISDMNPVSRNMSFKNPMGRRPTLAEAGGISATSTSSLPTEGNSSKQKEKPERPPGLTPNSVFLHLFYQPILRGGSFKPIRVPQELESSLRVLDRISPLEHHKIGVMYVGPGQKTEAQIFKNTSGSQRYYNFLDGLGAVFEIEDLPPNTNLGGLDKRGVDGKLVYMWNEDLMQVIFHVATSMPNKPTDPNGNNKKRHIGNDYVNIVYNNSGRPYALDTVKTQFNHAVVEIVPGDHNTNLVRLLVKPELSKFVSWDREDTVRLVSDVSLPVLGRQMALHANMAATVWESLKKSNRLPYATNWMERLRKIRAMREKILGKEEADRHMVEMQEQQYPTGDAPNSTSDDTFYSNLDFADWIDVEKEMTQERSSNANFVQKNLHFK